MSERFSLQDAAGHQEDAAVESEADTATSTNIRSAAGQAHAQISRFLRQELASADAEVSGFSVMDHSGSGNVVGVGLGTATPHSAAWIAEPGAPTLRVYLIEPMSEPELRQVLQRELAVEEAEEPTLPIQPVVTGEITAFSHSIRHRPAHGGLSVAHERVTAGTLGCLVRGRSGERRDRTLILSNNHVLANGNQGCFGDPVLQPGPHDGGTLPKDQIAALERYVELHFAPSGKSNEVDCATAWADPSLVDPRIAYVDHGQIKLLKVSSRTTRAREGDRVGKSGRTSQLTSGQVMNANATVKVRFGPRLALFEDQIEITGLNGPFGAPGDSGSLIWTLDEERHPVGLLFAGGVTSIFANPIDTVLDALDVDLIT